MAKYRTLIEVFDNAFRLFPDRLAVRYRNLEGVFQELKYRELEERVYALSLALISLGVKAKSHIGLIADVSYEWLLSNLAIQYAACVDVPRGTDSTEQELGYILSHSEAELVFVRNSQTLLKIQNGLKKHKHKVKNFVILEGKKSSKKEKNVYFLEELLDLGEKLKAKESKEYKELLKRKSQVKGDDLCTIIYTSGTTGEPKGVMLLHRNFASQLNILPSIIKPEAGDRGLTLLPPWHVFGRISEYMFLATGCSITYTDIKHIAEDMRHIRPNYVPAVPRIWEGVYNKILAGVKKQGKEKIFNFFKNIAIAYQRRVNRLSGRERLFEKRHPLTDIFLKGEALLVIIFLFLPKKLGDILVFRKVLAATGGELKASISGGGALPPYIDEFFMAIGIRILEGYGLTETSPVLAVRRPEKIVPGTVGPLFSAL